MSNSSAGVEGDRLDRVYWLGGSPCSGKSSVADLIGERYGVAVYHVDDAVREKFGPYDAVTQPCMHRWTVQLAANTVTWDDIWMRPVADLHAEVLQCYTEQFALVVGDLTETDRSSPVLVEGNPLMPELVIPLLKDRSQAVWMLACESFQRRMYARRGPWVQEILGQCGDPTLAFENWMARDAAFATRVADEAECQGAAVLRVDGSLSLEESADWVAGHLNLPARDTKDDL